VAQEKGKPTVETVQQQVKVSDLLMLEVCQPLKEQLDKIKICNPHIVEPIENPICPPLRSYGEPCLPLEVCSPLRPYGEIPCQPLRFQLATNALRQRLLTSDFEQLNAEVEKLKKDIEVLKSKK